MENNVNVDDKIKTAVTLVKMEAQLGALSDDVKALRAQITRILDDLEGRMRCVEARTGELATNQKTTTGILAGLQIVIGALAAWLGSR